MSDRDVSLYIKDMLESMERAENFVEGMEYDDFSKDEKTSFAVIRCIEVMGEAAKQVPESIRKKHPGIPWKSIAGMRDKVIHFYFGVNLEKVWLVVKEDLPKIKPKIRKILEDLQIE